MTPGQMKELCGYHHDPKVIDEVAATQAFPSFGAAAGAIKGSGKGKDIFLWDIEKKLTGKVRDPHTQTQPDCVGHGLSGAAEDLLYVQIYKGEEAGWEPIASEPIYGGSRHQIGRDQLGRNGGSIPGWAIQWAQQFGLIPRRKYDSVDLTQYNGNLAAQWGQPGRGCPPDVAENAKHWPLKTASLIQGPNFYDQARDVIANSGLVISGSQQLYSNTRDQFGFCVPSGDPAGHCVYFRGVSDNGRRPGIAYQQSWGNLIPRGNQNVRLPHGVAVSLPNGCFFIDAEEFDNMHNQQNAELWAVTSLAGWEPAAADWTISFV